MATDEGIALVALLRYTDAGHRLHATTTEVLERGSALRVLEQQTTSTLFGDPVPALLARANDELSRWSAFSRVLTLFDDDYPPQFREIHDLPPILFTRGRVGSDRRLRGGDCGGRDHGVCVVGSRHASQTGLEFATELAAALTERQVTVVSGLAAGIDTAAHRGALDHGGRTVAVLGTGIDRSYPVENRGLHRQIERRGAVIAQFWPGSPPTKTSFPARNATMSGYGACTIVVEATDRSGTRIQTRQAIAHGRPVLLTRATVEATRWAQDLARSAYDVTVVNTVDDALAAIAEILRRRPSQLEALLRQLIG